MSVQRPRQPDAPDQIAERTVNALTEAMVVDEHDRQTWSDREVKVYSGENERYLVHVGALNCTCKDWEYRKPEGGCKHIRRARYALGLDEVPDWVDRSALDPSLRLRVEERDAR